MKIKREKRKKAIRTWRKGKKAKNANANASVRNVNVVSKAHAGVQSASENFCGHENPREGGQAQREYPEVRNVWELDRNQLESLEPDHHWSR